MLLNCAQDQNMCYSSAVVTPIPAFRFKTLKALTEPQNAETLSSKHPTALIPRPPKDLSPKSFIEAVIGVRFELKRRRQKTSTCADAKTLALPHTCRQEARDLLKLGGGGRGVGERRY